MALGRLSAIEINFTYLGISTGQYQNTLYKHVN